MLLSSLCSSFMSNIFCEMCSQESMDSVMNVKQKVSAGGSRYLSLKKKTMAKSSTGFEFRPFSIQIYGFHIAISQFSLFFENMILVLLMQVFWQTVVNLNRWEVIEHTEEF